MKYVWLITLTIRCRRWWSYLNIGVEYVWLVILTIEVQLVNSYRSIMLLKTALRLLIQKKPQSKSHHHGLWHHAFLSRDVAMSVNSAGFHYDDNLKHLGTTQLQNQSCTIQTWKRVQNYQFTCMLRYSKTVPSGIRPPVTNHSSTVKDELIS